MLERVEGPLVKKQDAFDRNLVYYHLLHMLLKKSFPHQIHEAFLEKASFYKNGLKTHHKLIVRKALN